MTGSTAKQILRFPKIRGTISGIPIINDDCSILGSRLGSYYLGKTYELV